MKIIDSINRIEKFKNPVLTIGNYDGVHIGHQKIIERVIEEAAHINGVSMLMTFHPHPLSVLKPEKHLGLLTPLYVKEGLIEECGIEVLLAIPFTDSFRQIDPEVFFKDILVDRIGIKGLIVGYDFRFGKGGRGNTEMLKRLCDLYDIFFEVIDAVTIDNEKVGSNRIRKMIIEGRIKQAEKLLGRTYHIEGRVVKGANRGKSLGFPTVNLETSFEVIPKKGVYISEVGIENRRLPSVTNIGYNPTFGGRRLSIETFILDFEEDIYGRKISLYFHDYIRDEKKFNNIDELKKRILTDIEIAKEFFDKNRKNL